MNLGEEGKRRRESGEGVGGGEGKGEGRMEGEKVR